MATFTFEDIVLASGTLQMSFTNDNGDSSTIAVPGRYVVKFGVKKETVEERGFGGVLRIPTIELTVFDRGDVFKNQILKKGTVTKCNAKLLLTDGVETVEALYGEVRLPLVTYPAYFDDEFSVKKTDRKSVV